MTLNGQVRRAGGVVVGTGTRMDCANWATRLGIGSGVGRCGSENGREVTHRTIEEAGGGLVGAFAFGCALTVSDGGRACRE